MAQPEKHIRLTYWKHQTKTGEIVYKRPKNLINPITILRLTKYIRLPDVLDKKYEGVIEQIIAELSKYLKYFKPNPKRTSILEGILNAIYTIYTDPIKALTEVVPIESENKDLED